MKVHYYYPYLVKEMENINIILLLKQRRKYFWGLLVILILKKVINTKREKKDILNVMQKTEIGAK